MTIIVGIRCTDGVVIGTDSAMTFGPTQQSPTIEQTLRRKIDIIGERHILAGSGEIGLGQRFAQQVTALLNVNAFKDKNPVQQATMIAQAAVSDFKSTSVAPGHYGALFAMPHGNRAELVEFAAKDLQPEVKSDQNWYASMGSGQFIADPLLGFVRAALWGDDPPKRQDGVFAAYLVLHLVCKMAPVGIAPPIQMAVLHPDPGKRGQLRARLLPEDELLEHEESARDVLQHFRDFRMRTADAVEGAAAPPIPPSRDQPALP